MPEDGQPMFRDTVGAFCPHGRFILGGAKTGPLEGMTFGIKDLIDVAGHSTGAGTPRWLETHPIPDRTASCVERLLAAGATAVGKTVTDELAYSMNGDNLHYGTPVNMRAPGCTPGGSSAGSAAAVAAGLCSFALASDTGGSTRIPASFCGLFGIRPTHGLISMDGIVPLMPSFDTVSWLATDHDTFAKVGAVLLPPDPQRESFHSLVYFRESEGELEDGARMPFLSAVSELERMVGAAKPIELAPEGLEAWRLIYRELSAYEAWQIHGGWIEQARPNFAPAIAERFAYARSVDKESADAAAAARECIRTQVRSVLQAGTVAILPSAPGRPVRLGAAPEGIESFRQRAMRLTCIAGIASLPQVSVPGLTIENSPFGVSLLGPPGSDRELISLAGEFARRLRSPAQGG